MADYKCVGKKYGCSFEGKNLGSHLRHCPVSGSERCGAEIKRLRAEGKSTAEANEIAVKRWRKALAKANKAAVSAETAELSPLEQLRAESNRLQAEIAALSAGQSKKASKDAGKLASEAATHKPSKGASSPNKGERYGRALCATICAMLKMLRPPSKNQDPSDKGKRTRNEFYSWMKALNGPGFGTYYGGNSAPAWAEAVQHMPQATVTSIMARGEHAGLDSEALQTNTGNVPYAMADWRKLEVGKLDQRQEKECNAIGRNAASAVPLGSETAAATPVRHIPLDEYLASLS